ncbi:MAG: xanthine dehydrogenase family protein subunit M [Candidatus Binataceae bacterium]|jgi:carbon-monoxide dehydrogenase medium subunit
MPNAEYFAATDMRQALRLLTERGDQITILAGGTDLVPLMNSRELRPQALFYIGKLGLNYIAARDGGLAIGAATTLEEIVNNPLVIERAPVLAHTALEMGHPAIRNMATIGGNVAMPSRAADMPPPLLALDAEVVLVSERGERVVPIGEFLKQSRKTRRLPDELLTEIRIPPQKGRTAFVRLARRKVFACCIASAAVRMELDGDKCADLRIVAGSMAPTALRCVAAEAILRGNALTSARISEASTQALAECKPIDDERASAWYRRHVIELLVTRAINQAASL